MTRCFIALGSNLDQPRQQVASAINELSTLAGTTLVATSYFYQSTAIGPGEQPDYINAVVELRSQLQPLELLDALQAIENNHNRKRLERWGPRTLDLDLLYYGSAVINEPRLTVPHPRILERNFVLYPLADIAPDWRLHNQRTVQQQLLYCAKDGLSLVD
ncbi:2-amino-4-hydroxy-6-hydroxymethyldihydropteridine diphosphokinase [Oceanicoccus sp. KOV_DT_Chl]|uniref:2-amino-4-hydroxy-6- hydroxymethyldihydropteridine diphosphokinase n=1 Tax=Oceanicoccus sp. KOV_DT_Chl TaxID=1904639 RepID=UPI000C7BFEA4|nr:2-amino-4-hydroxy-6-hydroxymethyldihydropteridine diphosphokinase [Oceanicoccus sp. KOV_DT_Chl]